MSGQLEAAYKHMCFLGLITHDEKESIKTAVSNQDFKAACTQLCLLPVTRAGLQRLLAVLRSNTHHASVPGCVAHVKPAGSLQWTCTNAAGGASGGNTCSAGAVRAAQRLAQAAGAAIGRYCTYRHGNVLLTVPLAPSVELRANESFWCVGNAPSADG